MGLSQRMNLLIKGQDYTHPTFHIQLQNPKYSITSAEESTHQVNYAQLAREITKCISIGQFHVVKGLLELINYSLFLHENQVDAAFLAISKIDLAKNPKIKRLLFSELVRLNIWALISQGKAVLRGHYKANEFLNVILDNMPFAIYKIQQRMLPKELYEEVQNSVRHNTNQMMAVKDTVHYMIKNHVAIREKIMHVVLTPKVSSEIENLATLVNQGIHDNDPDAVQAVLNLAKATILRTVRKERVIGANQFEQFHEQIITKSLSNVSYQNVAFSILQMIGDFDLFLMKLKLSAYLLRQDIPSMQNCLQGLIANNDSLRQIGINVSLQMPVKKLTKPQLMSALYSFIDFLKDNKGYILKKMVTHHNL